MKQLIILLVMISVAGGACAQKAAPAKPEPFPMSIIKGKVSMYLKIPVEYKVVSCSVGLNSLGEIIQKENVGDAISADVQELFTQAVPGDKIWFDKVVVMKDGKKQDWPAKNFVVQ